MTTVVAQGTFDILHPGHIYYLREAASMGETLHVIVARRENVTHKEPPILPNEQRREVVQALEMVEKAHIGDPADIFAPITDIDPEIIALGFDQHHDVEAIQTELDRREIDCFVRRVKGLESRYAGELLSTADIIEQIIQQRGDEKNSDG